MIAKESIKGKYAGTCPNTECGLVLIENEINCPKCGLEFSKPAVAQTIEGKPTEDENNL